MRPITCRVACIPGLPGFPAVFGDPFQNTKGVNQVLIFWMNTDLPKHPAIGSRERAKKIMHLSHFFPGFSLIAASINGTAYYDLLDLPFVRISFTRFRVPLFFMVIDKSINNVGIGM